MSSKERPKPLVLCILDGFGEREAREANAVKLATTPNLAEIAARFPKTRISASGPDVGLPKGQMGNSEVGHLNFGAGRVAQMDLSRIDVDVAEGRLGGNPLIANLIHRVRFQKRFDSSKDEDVPIRFHLFGLVSDGGVHSSMRHLGALIDAIAYFDVPVVVHAFLDGRDTPPKSALDFVARLQNHIEGRGVIGTVGGRYWGMDRDQRWERVHKHYVAMVRGECESAPDAVTAVAQAYKNGVTDEFVEPVRIGDYKGMYGDFTAEFGSGGAGREPTWTWRGEEVGLCFNFRPDRMRQLCAMLLRKNLPPEAEARLTDRGRPLTAFTTDDLLAMTEYDPKLGMRVAFPKEEIADSFGEVISRAGLKQFRCAETEKYAHVTYFFNGGREAAFEGEERKVVPSPRDVATYDLKPEMSAAAVTEAVKGAIDSGSYDFVLVNFANPDMVGHTGVLDAATHAVEAVDRGIGVIRDAVLAKGGALIITADHGNCETMVDENGQPHTAHTQNPVPLYYVTEKDDGVTLREGGRLADVAPMMLEILGIEQPAKMTGRSLRVPKP